MPIVPDWYCCLSVAVDTEEDDWYNQQFLAYLGAGGDPKKFPKRKKRYGQRSVNQRPGQQAGPEPDQETPYDIVTRALGGGPIGSMKGDVDTWAKARGMRKVLQMPDGTFTDEAGNPVEPNAGSIFVPSSK